MRSRFGVVSVGVLCLAPSVSVAALPVYGGPTYSSTGTPNGASTMNLPALPARSVAEGFVAGYGTSYSNTVPGYDADLPYRWDASGAVVTLGNTAVQPIFNNDYVLTGIAPHGSVVGTVFSPGFVIASSTYNGVHFSRDNVRTTLAKLPSFITSTGNQDAVPLAVNRNDVVAGYGELWGGFGTSIIYYGERAVRWDTPSSAATNLGTISVRVSDNAGFSRAIALNAAGDIAGVARLYGAADADLGQRAVRWTPGSTTPIQLGHLGTNLAGVTQVNVNAINAGGTIVGNAATYRPNDSSGGQRAARWDVGSNAAVQLGFINTSGLNTTTSDAFDINDSGTIVGYAQRWNESGSASRGLRAVRWDVGGGAPTELAVLSTTTNGTAESMAYAINNRGYISGYASRYAGTTLLGTNAIVWRPDTSLIDLNTLLPANSGWTLTTARDISEAGFVSGLGIFDPDGAGGQAAYTRGFMMMIPEAGTYGLGDANFDQAVNFSDLLLLAKRFNQPNPGLSALVADFDLNGITDFNDLLRLAQNYGSVGLSAAPTSASDFNADWALAQAMVPEPQSLLLVAVCARVFRRRRLPA